MIIVKSPFRITLGGGTADFEDYFTQHGPTISTGFTINKYCYVSLMHLPNINGINYQIAYSTFERTKSIVEIKNPGVRGTLEYIIANNLNKLGINIINEINPRTGVGSSSAMICALTKALYAYSGRSISKKDLAETAIQIERYHLKESGGWNDQIFTSFGDFISIQYNKNKSFVVKPLAISSDFKNEFLNSCVLYYTSENNTRNSFDIIKSYDKTLNYTHEIAGISQEIKIEMENENIVKVGKLIHKNWKLKRQLSSLMTDENIDGIYDKILDGGAIGGRLIGGGAAGFIFAVYPDETAKNRAVKSLNIPFIDIGLDERGTEIIFNEQN